MGAWDTGPFDNDDANDWLYDLEAAADASVIESALQAVIDLGDDYIEAPECSCAVAAAEVLAALRGHPAASLPDNAKQWVERHRALDVKKLVPEAIEVLERIRADSELKELWDESKDAPAWYASLEDLSQRLTS